MIKLQLQLMGSVPYKTINTLSLFRVTLGHFRESDEENCFLRNLLKQQSAERVSSFSITWIMTVYQDRLIFKTFKQTSGFGY